jgi:C4-dicarboxylate transporter, DctM subunit
MSPEVLGLVGIGVMLLLMFIGLPVGVCTIFVGIIGFAMLTSFNAALTAAQSALLSTISDYTFAALPIFLLMGEFADLSRMMNDAYSSVNAWVGRLPGGLAMASILGSAAFSSVSGSSMACAAVMTRVALPQLIRYKYDPALATGALCAGGTLGNLIPPGAVLIIYAVIAEVSLGKLFIACYIPGFMLALLYLVQIYIQCKIKPSLGPKADITSLKEKLIAIKGFMAVLITGLIVFGGIQFGVFTANEAAAISTVLIFLYALIRRTVTGKNLLQAFKYTFVYTGMALAVIIGANIFGTFITASGLAQSLVTMLMGINLSALGLVLIIMVIYTILGFPLSPLTVLLVTLPILLPVLRAFNVNLLWFGVLVIVQCELAAVTPPAGGTLFVVAGMVKPFGIDMSTVFRGVIPFCITCFIFNIILVFFPQISLFLVGMMK